MTTPDDYPGPLNDPNVLEGHDLLRLDTPERCLTHMAVSMMTIAGVERDYLDNEGATAQTSAYFVDPSNKAHTLTTPPTFDHEVTYEQTKNLAGGDEEERHETVTVKRLPARPDYEGLSGSEAIAARIRYERMRAAAPMFRWTDEGGVAVEKVHDGKTTKFAADSIDLLESAKAMRAAAVETALERGRHDVVMEISPADDEA